MTQEQKRQKMIDEVADFLETAYNDLASGGDGCWHHKIDPMAFDDLCVVVAKIYEDDDDDDDPSEIMGKIAYNCDDLQCDYDYDWYMPFYKDDGECWFTDIPINNQNFKNDAEWFVNGYLGIVDEIEKDTLVYNRITEEEYNKNANK